MAGLFFGSGIDKGFENDLERMIKKMNIFSTSTQAQGVKISDVFKGIGKAVAGTISVMAVGAAGKELISFTKDLETALTEVSTISSEVSANFDKYKDSILALSTEGSSGAIELSNAFYDIVSAGYDGAKGLELLAVSEQAAIGGFVEVGTAADGLTTILNAWGKSTDEASSVSDILFKTVEKGKTTFPELGANIAKIAPLAASMGISFEEAAASIATITKSGTKTPEALTQIRGAMIAVNKVMGDGWSEAYTFQEALQKVADAAGGSQNKLKELVGTDEGVLAVLSLTGKNAAIAASDLDAMSNSLGATAAAAEKVTQTTDFQVKQLKNNILAALEPLGDAATGVIGDLATKINEAFQNGDIEKYAKLLLDLGKAFVVLKVSLIAYNQIQKLNVITTELHRKAQIASALAGKSVTAGNIAIAQSFKTMKAAFASNPIGILVTALTLAYPLIKRFVSGLKEVDEVANQLADVSKETAGEVSKETASLKVLQSQLQRTLPGSKERVRLVKELNDEYPDLLKNIDGEKVSIEVLNASFDSYIKNLEKVIRLKVLQSKFQELINNEVEIQSNKDLSKNEAYEALKLIELKKKALTDEIIYQKNIVDVSQRYADLIKEQNTLIAKQKSGGAIGNDLINQVQSYEDFVKQYKEINSTLPNGQVINKIFSKEELDKAYLEEQGRQSGLVQNTKNTADRIAEIQKELDNELKGIVTIATTDKVDDTTKKKTNEDLLAQLELETQQEKNLLLAKYTEEEKLQDSFNNQLLKNHLAYLQKKQALTVDELEKAKIEQEVIEVKSVLSVDSDQAQLNLLLAKYKTYVDKRKDIQEKYQTEIETLITKGFVNEAKLAENRRDAELKSLEEATLQANVKFQEWLNETLPDIASDGLKALNDELGKLKISLDTEILSSDDTVAIVNQIEILKKKIEELEPPIEKTKTSFKDTLEIINGVNNMMSDLNGSFGGLSEKNQAVAESITDITSGLIGAAQGISSLSASMSTLDKASVILLVISSILKVMTAITSAQKAQSEAFIAGEVAKIEAIAQVNQALIEQIALYEEGNEFFSNDNWGTALAGLKAYNEALEYQKEVYKDILVESFKSSRTRSENDVKAFEYTASEISQQENALEEALSGIGVKTLDRGSLSLKGDEYESLLDLYPDLIKANGELDAAMLQTAIDSRDISDIDKANLQNLVDVTLQMEEVYSQFGDYISEIFGGVGDSVAEAFQSMYESGDDAMTSLQSSFSDMIESFTNDAIEFAFLQPYLKELNDITQALGEDYAKGDITSDELQSGVINALGSFYETLGNGLDDQILAAYATADELAAAAGFDSAFNADTDTDTATTSTSTAGAISQSITEETGTILAGHIGAMRLSNERIATYSEDMLDLAVQNLVTLNAIKINTDYLPAIEYNTKRMADALS